MPWSLHSAISLRSRSAWASSCSVVFGLGAAADRGPQGLAAQLLEPRE